MSDERHENSNSSSTENEPKSQFPFYPSTKTLTKGSVVLINTLKKRKTVRTTKREVYRFSV